MKLKIKLFGILADNAGKSEIEIEIDDLTNTDNMTNTVDLSENINKKYPEFGKTNYAIAVNKKVVSENREVKENDEIALLPPFAGG